jgi:hypothetical protein
MKLFMKFTKKNKGQSFVELALVFTALLIILLGVVELGFLLNQYLELQDTVREIARIGSKNDPWQNNGTAVLEPAYFAKINDEYAVITSRSDLALNPATDDIVLSFYQVNGLTVTKLGSDWKMFGNSSSQILAAEIATHVSATAPCAGLIVVEGFYDYHQLRGAGRRKDRLHQPRDAQCGHQP